jgi:hypothetical protein
MAMYLSNVLVFISEKNAVVPHAKNEYSTET